MADNYLEKRFEDMRSRESDRQSKEERLRQRAWKKRMDAYRKRLAEEAAVRDAANQEGASGVEVGD